MSKETELKFRNAPASSEADPEAPLTLTTDAAKPLLLGKKAVLECWPAEEYLLKRGKDQKGRTVAGSLVMLTETRQLAQLQYLRMTSRGRRMLGLQDGSEVSVHDVEDKPWPYDKYTETALGNALGSGVHAQRIRPMSLKQVTEVVYRVEQAKYCSTLMQQLSKAGLTEQGKASLKKQIEDCAALLQEPPACAVAQAGQDENSAANGSRALVARVANVEGTPDKSMSNQGKLQSTGNKVHTTSALELPPVRDNNDSPKGAQTNQARLPTDKQTLPGLLQSLSHQRAWKAQFVQKLGMDNLLTACIQTCGTVQAPAGDNAAQDAVQRLARTMKDHQLEFAQRTAKLAAAVLAAVLAFGKSHPGLAKRLAGIKQPETGQQLVPAHPQAAPAGSVAGGVMNDVSQALRALRHAASAASKEQLEALNQAQQALDHAMHCVGNIIDGLNQHAQALISSQALTPAQAKQLKSFLDPASTQSTTPTASTDGLNDVSVRPTATAMAPASTAGKQQDSAKGQQGVPEQGITAKQKRKRIEWDAQVAAATNAQTLRAAALAAHAQQVTASEAKAGAVKTPAPATKRQKAPEHKSDPAAAGSKPKTATGTMPAKQSRQQSLIGTATASSLSPAQLQDSAAQLASARSPAAKQQSSAPQPHTSGKSHAPGTARSPDSKQPLLTIAATRDSKKDLPDSTTAAAGNLSAQSLVESLPKTPPGTPPVTPTKTVARQPGSASKSDSAAHENGAADNSVWQGDVTWQWGSSSAARGGFTGSLTHVSSFPSGSRWNADSELNLELDSHSLQFTALRSWSPAAAHASADAYTGHLFLLSGCSTAGIPQALRGSLTELEHSDAAPSAHLDLKTFQGELSQQRLLGCLEASGGALVASWGRSLCNVEDTAKSDALHLLLVACTSVKNWLPVSAMTQLELAEIAALQQEPATLWALPFLSDPPLPPVSVHGTVSSAAAQSATTTPTQPQLALKTPPGQPLPALSAGSPPQSRNIAPAGPVTRDASEAAKHVLATGQHIHVTAYQPGGSGTVAGSKVAKPNSVAAAGKKSDEQQTTAAAWLEGVLAGNGAPAAPTAILRSTHAHQVAEPCQTTSASHAAKKVITPNKLLKAPAGTANIVQAVQTVNKPLTVPAVNTQQSKATALHTDKPPGANQADTAALPIQQQAAQAGKSKQHQTRSSADTAPQQSAAAANGKAATGLVSKAAPNTALAEGVSPAAEQSNKQETVSRKRERDQQPLAGPTRSGSPACSLDLLAKSKSGAADGQTHGAAKQARARRAKPTAPVDSTSSDEGLSQQQHAQHSKGHQPEGHSAHEKRGAQRPAKRQRQGVADKAVSKKAKYFESQPASSLVADTSKAASSAGNKKRQPSKESHAGEKQPDVRTELPSQTLDNIYDSLKQLGLLRNIQGQGELTRSDIQALDTRAPLLQLRIMSQYASKFQVRGNPEKFLHISISNMIKLSGSTGWLAHRTYDAGTPRQHHFSPEAHALHRKLVQQKALPEDAVSDVALQTLPTDLQPAYVLALSGYPGRNLPKFARTLLHSILWQVCWAVQQQFSTLETIRTAMDSYIQAVGKPFTSPGGHAGADKGVQPTGSAAQASRIADQETQQDRPGKRKHSPIPVPDSFSKDSKTAPVAKVSTFVNGLQVSTRAPIKQSSQEEAEQPVRPKQRVFLPPKELAEAALHGLVRLGNLLPDSLDDLSLDFLYKQSPLWQMRILSTFSERVNYGNASAFLTSICKTNKHDAYNRNFKWVQPADQTEGHALKLLKDAWDAGIISEELVNSGALTSIPADLHSIVICYAVGSSITAHSHQQNHPLTLQVSTAVGTIVRYIHQVIEEEVPHWRPLAPSGSARPHTAPPSGNHIPSYPPLQAQNSFPSSGRAPSQQQQSHAYQQHPQHGIEDFERPCPSYFRSDDGCKNQGCPYIHCKHEKYVSYMKRLGLIPYGLKFQSQLGRDRCLGDDAVELLNELMANNFIPRGSFEDWDLQSLAFLEDPVNGNASKLQLQVVQRLSQLQNVEQPAAVLADLVLDMGHAQAGEHNQAPMSAPDTANMAPSSYSMSSQHGGQTGLPDFTPYDPFAPESNDGPHQSLADHHSQTPFQHALPDAPFHPPLHHTAPADFAAPDFAPSPEPAVEESLPFPCFRYEEELAAALLQNGAVHNVEHLLTVAPGCTMPPEVLDCFQGRWPGDIEGFLMSRPWIFSVSPNHVDVTDNARVGLVYKREVLQALWHALHDKVQLSLGDIAEIGPRLARINDIIADHGGLVKFLSTSLFSEDVELRFFGPGNTRVMLRPHLARGARPNF